MHQLNISLLLVGLVCFVLFFKDDDRLQLPSLPEELQAVGISKNQTSHASKKGDISYWTNFIVRIEIDKLMKKVLHLKTCLTIPSTAHTCTVKYITLRNRCLLHNC